MGNGMTGYNEQEVIDATNGVKNGIDSFFEATNTRLQSDFVQPMENLWASENAVSYFGSYAEAVRSNFEANLTDLSSIVDHFNSACSAYAEESGASYSPVSFDAPSCECDVSGIQNDINGTRGINRSEATETAQVLNEIKDAAIDALEEIRSSASYSGFYGESNAHQDAIDESIEGMKNAISALIEDQYTAVMDAIQVTADEYGDLEQRAAAAASGAN